MDKSEVTKKVYLGDGLYCSFDGYQFVLTAENGISVTNIVYLEPSVLDNFFRHTQAVREAIK